MMFTTTDVSLLSLDTALALVGGYAGTVWLLIACACGGFAQFAYQNSLVREFIKKRRRTDQVAVAEEEEMSNDIEQVINSTEPVIFSYAQSIIAQAASIWCFCKETAWMRRQIRQNRLHTKAFDEISKEIDITRFIRASRASRVMTKMFLKPN
jgi:G:T/U-mismatch repair DNA glycosylase